MAIIINVKKENKMKQPEEITMEDLNVMERHHKLMAYTDADIAELFNMVRMFVDQHQGTCLSCRNNLREAKEKLNSYYLAHREAALLRISNQESRVDKAIKEVKEYSKRLCECGAELKDKRRKKCKECSNK